MDDVDIILLNNILYLIDSFFQSFDRDGAIDFK